MTEIKRGSFFIIMQTCSNLKMFETQLTAVPFKNLLPKFNFECYLTAKRDGIEGKLTEKKCQDILKTSKPGQLGGDG